jgi:chromosome segregation ATPase
MGIFTDDHVERARKALVTAEGAAGAEARRLAQAQEEAERHVTEAAAIDPDSDPKAFEKATAKQAQLRATLELMRARNASAKDRVEQARTALAEVEQESIRARLAETNEKIDARQVQALDDVRDALDAFERALHEIASLTEEAKALAARVDPAWPHKKVHGRDFAGLVGNPARAVLFLAERGDLRV